MHIRLKLLFASHIICGGNRFSLAGYRDDNCIGIGIKQGGDGGF